ncbi:ABC transporter substrate-binding protein [Clostridium grantii]|uniref:ABC-type glycerol-3-phosphate transport system, substrate-binding protein n=1 Tax=Clostridium grantii DSM 8605 TaxID=1121316 RepID=A0A1M5UBC6_9CLOT|nr:ABC transporter substrate-binding protein [Clostridium grantii]SHH60218.1 ABC-type glycerol-3-phosphate transport system, substrate-binding protein [Clostridium grantii DSM 8605]
MKTKKILSMILASSLSIALLAGCGGAKNNTSSSNAGDGAATEDAIKGEITVLTNRTDLVDNLMLDYAAEFNKVYPDVKVSFEAMVDYPGEVKIRMNTEEYGDVLLIPNDISLDELGNFFEPLGTVDELSSKYKFVTEKAFDGTVYGIPTYVTAKGLVYNKKVFEEAGITEIPATPEDFIKALQMIKDNTESIPYYTNYAAGWPLGGQWEDNGLSIAGDENWQNTLPHNDAPWAKGEPYYVLSKLLYDMVDLGLVEEDPTTSDWEGSKAMLNKGEIACMLLGSWSITQMQEAGEFPDDIGYMPFPYTNADGNVYSNSGGDYKIGINKYSKNKAAAEAWLTWFVEESNFTKDAGGIPVMVGAPLPENLKAFDDLGVKLIGSLPAPAGEETYLDDIDNEAEIGRWSESYRQRIVEAALGNNKESLEDIMTDLNTKWAAAKETLGIK